MPEQKKKATARDNPQQTLVKRKSYRAMILGPEMLLKALEVLGRRLQSIKDVA